MIELKHWEITQKSKPEDLMAVIFKTKEQKKVGTMILNGILEMGKYSEEGNKQQFGIYEEDMKKIFEATGVSRPTFFKVLKRLRHLGMINKDFTFYYLSTDFPNALRRLERTARSIIENKIKDVKSLDTEQID